MVLKELDVTTGQNGIFWPSCTYEQFVKGHCTVDWLYLMDTKIYL